MQITRRTVAMLILAALFLVSGAMVLHSVLDARENAAETAEARDLAKPPPATEGLVSLPSLAPGVSAAPGPSPTPALEELEIQYMDGLLALDLQALQEVNQDVVGWIEIPGTELSYPLLQGPDNYYYLTHSWKKWNNAGGAIYLDSSADPALGDFHTIIYGHRMNNDSMFGTLRRYAGQDYLEAHPNVYIVLADGVYRYEVYAAFEASVNSLVYDPGLSGRETDLIALGVDSSLVDAGIVPIPEDRLLTLSTCTAWGHANRWVVQCRLAETWPPQKSA